MQCSFIRYKCDIASFLCHNKRTVIPIIPGEEERNKRDKEGGAGEGRIVIFRVTKTETGVEIKGN